MQTIRFSLCETELILHQPVDGGNLHFVSKMAGKGTSPQMLHFCVGLVFFVVVVMFFVCFVGRAWFVLFSLLNLLFLGVEGFFFKTITVS